MLIVVGLMKTLDVDSLVAVVVVGVVWISLTSSNTNDNCSTDSVLVSAPILEKLLILVGLMGTLDVDSLVVVVVVVV